MQVPRVFESDVLTYVSDKGPVMINSTVSLKKSTSISIFLHAWYLQRDNQVYTPNFLLLIAFNKQIHVDPCPVRSVEYYSVSVQSIIATEQHYYYTFTHLRHQQQHTPPPASNELRFSMALPANDKYLLNTTACNGAGCSPSLSNTGMNVCARTVLSDKLSQK